MKCHGVGEDACTVVRDSGQIWYQIASKGVAYKLVTDDLTAKVRIDINCPFPLWEKHICGDSPIVIVLANEEWAKIERAWIDEIGGMNAIGGKRYNTEERRVATSWAIFERKKPVKFELTERPYRMTTPAERALVRGYWKVDGEITKRIVDDKYGTECFGVSDIKEGEPQ
jgi:(2Fe-2S) ferredoxin